MPTYDYSCDCGVVTEARQAMSVRSIVCPACGREATRLFGYADVYLIGETVAKPRVLTKPEKG